MDDITRSLVARRSAKFAGWAADRDFEAMSELTPEIAAEVVAAAQEGAEEAAGALSRALDNEFTMSVGEAATFDPAAPPEDFNGPGLAVVMTFGDVGAVAVLTEASGLTPDWAPSPDPTGESKLATLAQELSMLLVPETFMADDFQSAWVGNVSEALTRGGLAEGAAVVPLSLITGETGGSLWMLWPFSSPGEVLEKAEAEDAAQEEAAAPQPDAAPADQPPEDQPDATPRRIFDFSQLPSYSKSLLKVTVPLKVTLAGKRQTVDDTMRLGPGSILTFDKPCDAPVDVFIGEHHIALGETVKVGEKFGVKIQQILMPEEHFESMQSKAAG